jgi:NhaP-type Na+/H+ or K+/H+ antiporter
MADRKADIGTKAVSALAAMVAAFVARKVITFAWTKITGKEPPTHPEDPQVALAEALGWAALTGVTVEAARLLATRAAVRRTYSGPERESR